MNKPIAWIDEDGRLVRRSDIRDGGFVDPDRAFPNCWHPLIPRSDVDGLIEALKFYSYPSDYRSPMTGGFGNLYFDCGDKSRKALADFHAKHGGE